MNKLIIYIKAHWQRLLDIYIFLNFFGYACYQGYSTYVNNEFGIIEFAFLIHNLVLAFVFLFRYPQRSTDKNILHQLIALIAFFSGAFFMGQSKIDNAILYSISTYFTLTTIVLGLVTLLNLGKSFGVLIAFRKVKTKGLYSVVRHPMYGTDILVRVGFLIGHYSLFSLFVAILSTSCYIYRAILEERFLSQQLEYRDYQKVVKFRFIPYIY